MWQVLICLSMGNMTKTLTANPTNKSSKSLNMVSIGAIISIGAGTPSEPPKHIQRLTNPSKNIPQPHLGGASRPRDVVVLFFDGFVSLCMCFGGSEGVPAPMEIMGPMEIVPNFGANRLNPSGRIQNQKRPVFEMLIF